MMIETKWFAAGVATDEHKGYHLHVRIWKVELYIGLNRVA